MRSLGVISLLCSVCAFVQFAQAADKCDLSGAKRDVDFPNLEKEFEGMESFQLAVEYTVRDAKQTDYYVEYYDIVERRGRVEGHQGGKSQTYIYFTQSAESWKLTDRVCSYQNITDPPDLLKSAQDEWWYVNEDDEQRVFGPSAMFKYALDTWNSTQRRSKMAYMGIAEFEVRGLQTQYWRRCDTPTSFVDYYFTTDNEEDPLNLGLKRIPLRVLFGGTREGQEAELQMQQYEIFTFQPFISEDVKPFRLPKGRECKRGHLLDPPPVPDFSDSNLQFSAEVIYRKVDFSENDVQYWSYYSTLMMAIDVEAEHIAYYYTPWSDYTEGEPTVDSPEYVIYDMKHGYAYKTNVTSGACQIIREKSYIPEYKLPGDIGSIALTDPSVLFPNSELSFISEGENRGLKVNIFEETIENYQLDKKGGTVKIPKALISHSYLTNDELEVNKGSVKNALTQVQLRLSGRFPKVIELVTFNFFGFSTTLNRQRLLFNILKCYKNDNDYSYVSLGFSADKAVLENIKPDVPEIESNIMGMLSLNTELNPARVPVILVDMTDDGLMVTMLILGKPPVLLDYLTPEEGKTISGTQEVEGIQDEKTCAQKCLETEDNCWGFSMCGAVCYFGVGESAKPATTKNKCQLYRRYNNGTFIPSKELMILNLQREVESHQVKLLLKGKDDSLVQIEASSIEVTEPGEDERLFDRVGNKLNPRMSVVKAGYKLKSGSGTPVKNMGKLRYDECQRVCLDFKDCESLSYCLKDSECVLNKKFGEELGKDELEEDTMCSVLTRRYEDHFGRSPGNVLSITAKEVLDLDTVGKCARACLKSTKYKCLSFDHCPQDTKGGCKLHTVHYPNAKTREDIQVKSPNCGHYYRKYSTEFKKSENKRILGSTVAPISNLTLEECSKACMEYGKGTCYGFDFCQDVTILGTSCVLFDSDPSRLKSSYSAVCTNYLRTEPQFAPRPYSNGYAGGIGFLCFLIGLVVGALVVFAIAYFRVNRR